MAHSLFTFGGDSVPEVSLHNVEMANIENNGILGSAGNLNYARSSASIISMLHSASENGGSKFNIFMTSSDSNSMPKRDPRATQAEIKKKIANHDKIDNVRYTRVGSLIFSTKDISCATDVCNISEFLGVSVSTRVVWENITNRFLLFNIPVDVPLTELATEITNANGLNILELRRFIRKGSTKDVSPVLVTILGTSLPAEIKIWFSIQIIRQFIDRPRQCAKCFKFNHSTGKCTLNQTCATCGTQHEGACTTPISCANCAAEHRADYNQCPARIKEAEFLSFKCRNFLSFVDARRQFFRKMEVTSYAKVTSGTKTDYEPLQKCIETRTNAMLKILIDAISTQSDKVNEAITALSNLIANFLAKISEDPPDKRKCPGKGGGSKLAK